MITVTERERQAVLSRLTTVRGMLDFRSRWDDSKEVSQLIYGLMVERKPRARKVAVPADLWRQALEMTSHLFGGASR